MSKPGVGQNRASHASLAAGDSTLLSIFGVFPVQSIVCRVTIICCYIATCVMNCDYVACDLNRVMLSYDHRYWLGVKYYKSVS